MNERIISRYLCCPSCRGGELVVDVLRRDGPEVVDAVVSCSDCETWYRLEDGLLELLVPSLRLPEVDERFRARVERHRGRWGFGDVVETAPPDEHKLGQKTFYDDDAGFYETHMMRLPFWQSFDRSYMRNISALAGGQRVMVEIGGGSGRLSIPMHASFGLTLSFDISEAMVRRAMRRRDEMTPRPKNLHYFVADAENIPIRSDVADVTIFSGILHHVAAPDRVIEEALRTLRPGGRFIGMENNRSAFRPIFDWLMRVKQLWNEKAHPEHFIMSSRELHRWFENAGVSGEVWTSVFLPPHVFNLFGVGAAERVLKLTDSVARTLPWLRDQGGLVLFTGTKRGAPALGRTLEREVVPVSILADVPQGQGTPPAKRPRAPAQRATQPGVNERLND